MDFNRYSVEELERRHQLALELRAPRPEAGRAEAKFVQGIPFPPGLGPTPKPIDPPPKATDSLPKGVDVIAMVDTDDEAMAMADILTPAYRWLTWRNKAWYEYTVADFHTRYLPLLGPSSHALLTGCLGSYFLTQIKNKTVLCYKTDLHMFEDTKKMPDGSYSLPLKDMLTHIISEANPQWFLTTGTSGGLYCGMHLGDVVVSRAARFLCQQDFAPLSKLPPFKSDWPVPSAYKTAAEGLMQRYAGNLSSGVKPPPQQNCSCSSADHPTHIFFDGQEGIPEFYPILTTDFFEWGTSTNNLDKSGMACEMDDSVLGLACSEMSSPPNWACVRNLSDPAINGDLPHDVQKECARYYYNEFGYWTSVMSALATWAIIAGL